MRLSKKQIHRLDFVILFGSAIFMIFLIGYARPLVISPIDNFVTMNNSVLFSFENADLILIDDNIEFTSPEEIYVEDDLIINLKPGVYYWRIEGILKSEIRKLTVESEVNLKLKKLGDEKYEIVNSGNTRLKVDVYNDSILVERVILETDAGSEISGNKVIGGQDE